VPEQSSDVDTEARRELPEDWKDLYTVFVRFILLHLPDKLMSINKSN
jgi:hypothetical protein